MAKILLAVNTLSAQQFFKTIDMEGRSEFCEALEEYEGTFYALVNSFDYNNPDHRTDNWSILLHLDSVGHTLDSLFFFEPDSNIYWRTIKLLSDSTLLAAGELYCDSDTSRLILRRYNLLLEEIETKVYGSDHISYQIFSISECRAGLTLLGGYKTSSTFILLNSDLDSIYSHIIPNSPVVFIPGNYGQVVIQDSLLVFFSYSDQIDSTTPNYSIWVFDFTTYTFNKLLSVSFTALNLFPMESAKLGILDQIDNIGDDTLINGSTNYFTDLRFRIFDLNNKSFVTDSASLMLRTRENLTIPNNSGTFGDVHYVAFQQTPFLFTGPDFYSNLGILAYDNNGHQLNKVLIPWSQPMQANSITGNNKQLIIGGACNFTVNNWNKNQTSAFIMGFNRDLNGLPNALGLEVPDISNGIEIYPNPGTGKFYIHNPNHLNIAYIEIFDSQGTKVGHSENLREITLPNMSGIYTIYFMTSKGQAFSKKVVNLSRCSF
ncbi:MAG: T9SS type A sorting domain-containing protein [Bacteroidetes bacterium]|nr:T9SS type A sorting domain-containing protein [Bacteroidota bacterium]